MRKQKISAANCGSGQTSALAAKRYFIRTPEGISGFFLHTLVVFAQKGAGNMTEIELPHGLGMALAQNEAAMKRFESLSEAEKQAFVEKTHGVASKAEMKALVSSLTAGTIG